MGTPIFKGDRVLFNLLSDQAQLGERYGEVTSVTKSYINVRGEKSGKVWQFIRQTALLETTAPPVTMNDSCYVIRHSGADGDSDFLTTLGFDYCNEQTRLMLDWLMSKGHAEAGGWLSLIGRLPNPSIERYQQYRNAADAVRAQVDQTGERCPVNLTPQLIGLEGKRVEVVDKYGERRRFRVGRSTGWIPCHLEIEGRADGGGPVFGAPFSEVIVL